MADRAGLPVLNRPATRDVTLLGVSVLAVSTAGPIIAATAAPALAIAFWRNALGCAVVLPWAALRRGRELRGVDRRTLLLAVAAGALLAVHFGAWVPSLTLTSVASSTALVCTQPVWSALLARAAGHRVPRGAWIGTGIAVCGAAVLAGVDLQTSSRALGGDLLALLGAVAAAAYTTAGGMVRLRVSTTTYTAICYSVCAVLLLVLDLVTGRQLGGYPAETWVKLAVLTVAAQLLGHSLINLALRSASATVAGLFLLLEVPGATLIALVWLHQTPGISAIPGLALLLAGAAVVVRTGATLPDRALDLP